MERKNRVIVIGAGFSGLSASATLASKGFDVTLLEKNKETGGRARHFREQGFMFDMGPSWYWMPDVMERFFNRFGKTASDYFQLVRLNPSYQVIFGKHDVVKLPADFNELKQTFEEIENGSGARLEQFLEEAKYKYEAGMKDFVYKPALSMMEYAEPRLINSLVRLDLFRSFSAHVKKFFRDPRLIRLLEFPVLFLGATPSKTPALYSLMNYADMKLGTWYPMGGMYKLAEAMTLLAAENGVKIRLAEPVSRILAMDGKVNRVITPLGEYVADVVVAGADYHHVEQSLLSESERSYSASYWSKKVLSPSCLIYYLGINKRLKNLLHHNLFFDSDFETHTQAIYANPKWPKNPLFYVCCPSVTDTSVAPPGMENLFILIPVAAGLKDDELIREEYYHKVLSRLEAFCGEDIANHVIYKRSYAASDFANDYNSYKGNAYGLANTLLQTAFLRPSIRSRKIHNMFFTGQLTVPGPGVPPAIISGQVVADFIIKNSPIQTPSYSYERTF